jgi:hypothetical protein
MAPVNRYSATVHRQGDWWVIDVDGVGVTQAKRLDRAEHMARDLVAAVHDVDYDDVQVDVTFNLSPELAGVVSAAKAAAEVAKAAQQRATELSLDAVARLHGQKLSLRDIAKLTGVSFQRVHQLLNSAVDAGRAEVRVSKGGRSVRVRQADVPVERAAKKTHNARRARREHSSV